MLSLLKSTKKKVALDRIRTHGTWVGQKLSTNLVFFANNLNSRHFEIKSYFCKVVDEVSADKKCGTLHDFACHPCAGAMLIFSVSFQF